MNKDIEIQNVNPQDIERKSFEIISEILGDKKFNNKEELIVKRVIHTTADFDFYDIMKITEDAVDRGLNALKSGCSIFTDTRMAEAGINKRVLSKLGGRVECFVDNQDVYELARERNTTRSAIAVEKAVENNDTKIFVIGNAPTALIRLCELIQEKRVSPELVVGVPVGFVNVVESKEFLKKMDVPYILSNGRKGGSNIAAAIINALLYMIGE